VYREEMNDPSSKYAGTVEVIVALNRNGPAGNCRLLFRGDKYRCENLPPDWMPEETERKESKPARKGFKKVAGNRGADAATAEHS
jgi:replicative DNA helicase